MLKPKAKEASLPGRPAIPSLLRRTLFVLLCTALIHVVRAKQSRLGGRSLHGARRSAPTYSGTYLPIMVDQDVDRLDWVAPAYLVSLCKSTDAKDDSHASTQNVKSLARFYSDQTPWSVVDKKASMVPNGDVHEYVSFAPYYWPVSSRKALSTKVDPKEEHDMPDTSSAKSPSSPPIPAYCADPRSVEDQTLVWKHCPYEKRDGQRNPDTAAIEDAQNFRNATRGAFLNAVSYALTFEDCYAKQAASIVRVFFLDPKTAVRPHLKYGQIVRGPQAAGSDNDWSTGTHRAIIDWRHLVKLANAVIILRELQSKAWTDDDDKAIRYWAEAYFTWLTDDPLSLKAKNATNNFVSFWYSQAISIQLLLDDKARAVALANDYFRGSFRQLIAANGDQPQESGRTRAVHYRAFGVEPMILNARMAAWAGSSDLWPSLTNVSATINDAVNYALSLVDRATRAESAELAPHVASALAVYGDFSDGRYTAFLASVTATGDGSQQSLWRLFDRKAAFAFRA